MNTYKAQPNKNNVILTPIYILLTLLIICLLIMFPSIVKNAVNSSVNTCIKVIIPSLFPFMVLSEIFFSIGGAGVLGELLGKPFSLILGIPHNGVSAFLLGLVCGLPLGGKYALMLYEDSLISREECEKLMGISNNCGIGFVISGIGAGIWGNILFGIALYVCQIIASAIVCRIIFRNKKPLSIAPAIPKNTKNKFSAILCSAIANSALNILKIAAFIVCFAVIIAFLDTVCLKLKLPKFIFAVLSSFTELTYASNYLHSFAELSPFVAKLMSFFAVGFSGMSAHMQLSSFVTHSEISMKKYYLIKLACALICTLLGLPALILFSNYI